jgi:hypothetical protein
MKKGSIVFLRIIIILIGVGVLAFMLWEPHLEGRNIDATLFEVYFKDPFLAYVYVGSIPFFVALYQAIKVSGYVRQNKIFSHAAVKAVRIIKYCAFITAGAIVGAAAYLIINARLLGGDDDPAGAVMLGIIATFASIVIGAAATVFERVVNDYPYPSPRI